MNDPDSFLNKLLAGAGGEVARRMLIAQCWPHVVPSLPKQGLQWSDVQLVLELVESHDELQQAMHDPDSFLNKLLAGAGGEVARRMLIAHCWPRVVPSLLKQGLQW